MKSWRMVSLGLACLGLASASAFGFPIGNPIPRVDAGETVVEFAASGARRGMHSSQKREDETFFLERETIAMGYALADHRLFGLSGGALAVEPDTAGLTSSAGTEFGAFYRHGVATEDRLKHGFLVMYRQGNTSGRDSLVTLDEYTGAYGLSLPASDRITVYAAALAQYLGATLEHKATRARFDSESRMDAGAYGGMEVRVTLHAVLGVELIGGVETGGAAFFQLRF